MQPDRRPRLQWIAILAILCALLAAWIYLGFVQPFRAASGGRDMLPLRLQGYDGSDVSGLLQFLQTHPDAVAVQHGFNAGPALVFPVLLAALLFLLLKRAQPGGSFFGRRIPPAAIAALFVLPAVYGLAALAEVGSALLLFPPATPSTSTTAFIIELLPVVARIKLVALAVTVILLIRFAALSGRSVQE
jgi:hypothetical protein